MAFLIVRKTYDGKLGVDKRCPFWQPTWRIPWQPKWRTVNLPHATNNLQPTISMNLTILNKVCTHIFRTILPFFISWTICIFAVLRLFFRINLRQNFLPTEVFIDRSKKFHSTGPKIPAGIWFYVEPLSWKPIENDDPLYNNFPPSSICCWKTKPNTEIETQLSVQSFRWNSLYISFSST